MKFIKLDSRVLLISDYNFYAQQEEEIDEWLYQTFDCHPRQGMTITFRNEKEMLLFLLRWE